MSVDALYHRPFIVNFFDPKGATNESDLAQNAYWISSLVFGFLTAFIFHIAFCAIYSCVANRNSEPKKQEPIVKHGNPRPSPPLPKNSAKPSSGSKKEESKKQAPTTLTPNHGVTAKPAVAALAKPVDGKIPESYVMVPVRPKADPIHFRQNPKSLLKELREAHASIEVVDLPVHASTVMPIGKETVMHMAYKPEEVKVYASPFDTSNQFEKYTSIVFRIEKEKIKLPQILNVLKVWPRLISEQKSEAWRKNPFRTESQFEPSVDDRGCSTSSIDLKGCSQLVLDPTILVKKYFVFLNFDGCKFHDLSAFVGALAEQKELETLSLGLDDTIAADDFEKLLKGCPKLEKLTASVKSSPSVFPSSNVRDLTLSTSTLTQPLLEKILTQNKKLRSLTLWYDDTGSESWNIRDVIKRCSPKNLRHINLIQNTQTSLKAPYREKIDKTKILLTNIDLSFLKGGPLTSCNLWLPSFEALLKRFSSDSQQLTNLIHEVAKKDLPFEQLFNLCELLADSLNWMDFAALATVFKPFETTDNPQYNNNLELLLQLTLKLCLEKHAKKQVERSIQKGDTYHLSNAQIILRILHQWRDSFAIANAQLD